MRLHFLLAIIVLAFFLQTCVCLAQDSKSLLLLFQCSVQEGGDRTAAETATTALRDYFRDTGRVDVALFSAESPTVMRAVIEKRLTEEQVASYADRSQRIEVAKALGFRYAAGAEVVRVERMLTLSLWVADVTGRRPVIYETSRKARTGGDNPNDMNNAVQTAASGVVTDISGKAFADLPEVKETEDADIGTPSVATPTAAPPTDAKPTQLPSTDYIIRADDAMKQGNVAVAIADYKRAVDIEPNNFDFRLKLAEAFSAKGMFEDAQEQIARAVAAGADPARIAQIKKKIAESASDAAGVEPPPPDVDPTGTSGPESAPPTSKRAKEAISAQRAAIAKLIEGDDLWKNEAPDDAAAAYRESIQLNSSDWRAHERLAIVLASNSRFEESRQALMRLRVVQPVVPADLLLNRYRMFRSAFDKRVGVLIARFDSDASEFRRGRLSKDAYAVSIRNYLSEMDTMKRFLKEMPSPASRDGVNLSRDLACGLIAQAASSASEYLKTGQDKLRVNAAAYLDEARLEMLSVSRSDAGF